ncbi:MAG: hypothetical protein LAT68_01455 [Cyclobacteriaceae bacterium]|nr:hypothetical protein [Cyclobacteriaceae bacterium]MCH8514969.1 hypothetical protein [Cyclobacteriaceae bacterium]
MIANKERTRESRGAIERLYITMRHLLMRGTYKPMGVSGQSLVESLLTLRPEIYGTVADTKRVELDGLLYVIERLPRGIEECQFINLTAREGFEEAGHEPFIPSKRRRNCYRVDAERYYIEMTRGRSDIYDILTHLTFIYIEAEKIKNQALDHKNKISQDWYQLEEIVRQEEAGEDVDEKKGVVYLSHFLGRTVKETSEGIKKFKDAGGGYSLYRIVYYLGKRAILEETEKEDREISFSGKLREIIGLHVYGDEWASHIKGHIVASGMEKRKIHIISANLHSFLNAIYGFKALKDHSFDSIEDLANFTSKAENQHYQNAIKEYAKSHGFVEIEDRSGTNLSVQIIDMSKVEGKGLPYEFEFDAGKDNSPVLIVMDYAFGEQAYECMDELLKPYENADRIITLNISSVSIMGKAGILEGKKGDIMLPTAHVFEGTADNYPIENDFDLEPFEKVLPSFVGPMITVMGTSLQNRDVLSHFITSTWNAVGLEMEGAHYQKAIQSAAKIRKSIDENVKVRYAYYASDNPLVTGATLASGSLGAEGVVPTYLITKEILRKIFN